MFQPFILELLVSQKRTSNLSLLSVDPNKFLSDPSGSPKNKSYLATLYISKSKP